jgi:hypothetical protein
MPMLRMNGGTRACCRPVMRVARRRPESAGLNKDHAGAHAELYRNPPSRRLLDRA